MPLRETLQKLLTEYPTAKRLPLEGHTLAGFIRHDAAHAVDEGLGELGASALYRVLCAALVAQCVVASTRADAADSIGNRVSVVPKLETYDWSGFYFRGHVGVAWGTATATAWDAINFYQINNSFEGLIGGAQFGYNLVLPSQLLLGFEADASFINYIESNGAIAAVPTTDGVIRQKLDYLATARGRIGYAFAPWMFYGTVGLAAEGARFIDELSSGDTEKKLRLGFGWVAGGGVEYALTPIWTARLEYLHYGFGKSDVLFPAGDRYVSSNSIDMTRLGLSRKLNGAGEAATPEKEQDAAQPDSWQLHGQLTYVQQGYPSFRSPYEGTQSLSGTSQTRNTVSATAFLGARLWEGGEFFFAPEVAQGVGLSVTLGLGGFSNGEAQKAGFPYPQSAVRASAGIGARDGAA